MNITLKNVPEGVYRTIRSAAEREGRSLNSQIIRVLSEEAEVQRRRRRARDSRAALEAFVATLPALGDSTPLIRADRQR
jgi:hypothetical protein